MQSYGWLKKKNKSKNDLALSFLCKARIVFLIFKDSFDHGPQHADTGIDERKNSLLLTSLNERRLLGRATQQVVSGSKVTASWHSRGKLMYGKWSGVS